jgi:hypothetical protein
MSALTLKIPQEGEVTLPGEIANSTLSLAEIGALVVFVAAAQGEIEVAGTRLASAEMQSAMAALKEKGVITARLENKTLKLSVDLDRVLPAADESHEG